MKSLAELAAIREKMQNTILVREGSDTVRVVVGMATCGIAAGARPVISAFVEKITEAGLNDKVKELSKEPSVKPVNTNAKPNGGGSNYEAWRETMRSYLS